MRVAIFGPFHQSPREGGVEQHVARLSDSLEKSGVEVERWSWKAPESTESIRKFSLFGISGAAKSTGADIVHFHSTATTFSLMCGLGRFKGKSIATMHAFYHPEFENTLRMKALSIAFAKPYVLALRRLGRRIAVSEFIRSEAESNGVRTDAVINNGITLSEFRGISRRSELESEVVMVGRFTEQKGVFDFIEAFSGSGIQAALAGYGGKDVEERVRKLCEKGGIRCFVNPDRKVLMEIISSSKVFAFPSKYEPFGIVGLEAMALGKPVVVYSRAGGPLDYVSSGKNGMVISEGPAKLRDAVKSLLADSKKLGTFSKNAFQTASPYDWDKIAERTKAIYSSL